MLHGSSQGFGFLEPVAVKLSSLPHSDPDGSQGTSWRAEAFCPDCRGIMD